jgi:hypothetical protein
MEARQTSRGSAAPKAVMVVLAICAAAALAGAGSAITREIAGSHAATVKSTVHAAPGSVLRQDSPVLSTATPIVRGQRGGSQSIEDDGSEWAGTGNYGARDVRPGYVP